MRHAQMPAQHLAAISAFEANDMIALHRSPDWDRRLQRSRHRCRRALAEAAEGAMHRRNQARELIDADTILSDITTDNLRNQAPIDFLRNAAIGHIFDPKVVD